MNRWVDEKMNRWADRGRDTQREGNKEKIMTFQPPNRCPIFETSITALCAVLLVPTWRGLEVLEAGVGVRGASTPNPVGLDQLLEAVHCGCCGSSVNRWMNGWIYNWLYIIYICSCIIDMSHSLLWGFLEELIKYSSIHFFSCMLSLSFIAHSTLLKLEHWHVVNTPPFYPRSLGLVLALFVLGSFL